MSVPTLFRPILFAAAAFALGCSSTSTAGNASASNSSDQAAPQIAIGQNFAMTPGQSVALPERGTLRYVGVKSDSRCPPDRQCVWAGDAEVTFEWSAADAAPQTLALHTGFKEKSRKPMGKYTLSLESLARGVNPEAQLKLDSAP